MLNRYTHTHRHLPLFEEPNNIKNMEHKKVPQVTLEDRLHSFQIKYSENGQEYTLYIQVPTLLRNINRQVSKMTTTSPYRRRVMGNETSGYNWQGTLSVTTQVSKTGSIREFLQVWYKTCTFC